MDHHDHRTCISHALDEAEKLCADRGKRFTPLRRQVLELVWQNHKAVKAYDLIEALGEQEGCQIKPPTVYRALDFLIAEGLVHKIESLNAYVGCPDPSHGHTGQFMICDRCETVTEMAVDGLIKQLSRVASQANFKVTGQMIELHGRCAACQ